MNKKENMKNINEKVVHPVIKKFKKYNESIFKYFNWNVYSRITFNNYFNYFSD